MAILVSIRRNVDGVVRIHRDEFEWQGDYIWADGNYSCDCNRLLFFCRAADEDEPPFDEIECSDEKFSVRITDEAGKELYKDGSWDSKR